MCHFSFSKTDGVNHSEVHVVLQRAAQWVDGWMLWADLLRSAVSNTSTHPKDGAESSSRLHDPCLIFRKLKATRTQSHFFLIKSHPNKNKKKPLQV